MSGFCVYLCLPEYLAQWYAYTCHEHHFIMEDVCPANPYDPMIPVEPIKGSYESKVLQKNLRKQPTAVPEPRPEGATLALAIPYYKDKNPHTYNYLGKHARKELEDAIRNAFDVCLWEELHLFKVRLTRQDQTIYTFMENHGIADTETNWLAISKRYKRMRDVYNVTKCKKSKRLGASKKSEDN